MTFGCFPKEWPVYFLIMCPWSHLWPWTKKGLVESKMEAKLDVALWEDLKIDMEVSNLCFTLFGRTLSVWNILNPKWNINGAGVFPSLGATSLGATWLPGPMEIDTFFHPLLGRPLSALCERCFEHNEWRWKVGTWIQSMRRSLRFCAKNVAIFLR